MGVRAGFICALLGVLAPVIVACAGPARSSGIEADYLFENVHVVPMTSDVVLRDRAVAVRDGTIVAVLDAEQARSVRARQRIDGRGRHLMPGLADMHVHTEGHPAPVFQLQLAAGVTTVRNMSDREYDHRRMRDDVAAGRLDGPRYLISGPSLTARSLPSVADVEPMLDRHVSGGYDVVKVHGDLAPEVYDALLDGARRRGLRVAGHVQRKRDLGEALRMSGIEHAEEFLYAPGREALADPARADAAARRIADSGVYVTPTLAVFAIIPDYTDDATFAALARRPHVAYLAPADRDVWLSAAENPYRKRRWSPEVTRKFRDDARLMAGFVKRLHDAGVPLLLGTDAFGALVPGFAVHEELALMVAAGLTPYQALRTGTVNVARHLGEEAQAGTIEPGKRADFILVDGNPLADVAAASRVRGLFTRGRWRSEAELQAMLEGVPATLRAGAASPYALPSD